MNGIICFTVRMLRNQTQVVYRLGKIIAMRRFSPFLFRLSSILFLIGSSSVWSAEKKPAKVPVKYDFVRSVDVEAYAMATNPSNNGAEAFRIRTRYLDPEVNAFAGMITGLYRFNRKLSITSRSNPVQSEYLWNWGVDLGIKRGRSLWELDLMGAVLSTKLAPVLGFAGEHSWSWFTLYHRTEISLFSNDVIFDGDQGVRINFGNCGLTLGYRIFAGQFMNRSGPRAGVAWRFESPKIPFIFPSLG